MMKTLAFPKPLRQLLLTALLSHSACWLAAPTDAQADEAASLADYPLEQLMDVSIEVSSASRKPQKLEDTAAAIHVITRQDIRRSGMTSLPELLRMAPGIQVAHLDGSTWAISSRGFNAKNSDNLLVMLDGRVLQTPTFTGVYWDAQDVALEDVERIEVIRGPGGALWGANAVTGIINIITLPARMTQGGMLDGGAGSGNERYGTARFGGKAGETGHFRIYARDAAQGNSKPVSSAGVYDRHDLRSAGFRADWDMSGGNSLTVQGDTYTGSSDHIGTIVALAPPYSTPAGYTIGLDGGNLLARWKNALSATDEWALQFYYDTYQRRYFNLGERRDTYDLDFQHRFLCGERHGVVWGAGYRQTRDRMDNTFVVSYTPASRADSVASAFFQDEIALKDSLHLIVGTKFEHNGYTGSEHQPNLRLRWKIDERQTAWAAVSRAVHTPSRTDADGRIVSTVIKRDATTLVTQLQSNPAIQSERVVSYEAGYRNQLAEQVQMDAALFYSEHRHLMTIEREASFPEAGYTVVPLVFNNRASATTHGLEWSGSWRPTGKWQFKAAWSWLKMNIRRDAGSTDTSIETEAGRSPQNQLQFHALHSPADNIDLGASLYYVDSLPSLSVPAYTRLDARIGWRIGRDLELSLTGRNLLDPGHPEFVTQSGPRTSEVPRSLLGGATWRF